jgi:hypothetical protein
MKKTLLILTICGLSFVAKSQNTNIDASVEKSIFGIQTGIFGIWAHNETKLSNKIVLRTELGFDSEIRSNNYYKGASFFMTPVIILEPRFYYNLNKRVEKSRRIDGNSGNFISLKTSYHPDWFAISNSDDVNLFSSISITPTWGIRRNIGKHFNYEAGVGVGYTYKFTERAGFSQNNSLLRVDLNLRIGYWF